MEPGDAVYPREVTFGLLRLAQGSDRPTNWRAGLSLLHDIGGITKPQLLLHAIQNERMASKSKPDAIRALVQASQQQEVKS
jgi:hypothetical protein